jgi:uncharacterized protein (DUF1800 family)
MGAMRFLLTFFLFGLSLAAAPEVMAGGVLREVWTDLPGLTVADLQGASNFPGAPVYRVVDPEFRAPANWRDFYGLRMRALLTPEVDGAYTFWVAGDDNCELWLSSDATPEKKVRIARVPGWTAVDAWTKYPEQRSAPVPLVAGRQYYIEALMKEGAGLDSLSVAWAAAPDGPPVVIGERFLAPFEVPAVVSPGLLVEAGAAVRQHAPNLQVELMGQAVDLRSAPRALSFSWSQVSGSPALLRTPAGAGTLVDLPEVGTYVFRVTAGFSGGSVSDEVTVTILPKLAPDAGQALSEYWLGVEGKTVANLAASLDYPSFPHARRTVTSLSAVENVAEQFGARTRGFLLVPESGVYRFFLAANESAEFSLSETDSPANLRTMASVSAPQMVAGGLDVLGQPSEGVELTAGRRYAFRILHKDDWGSDSCALRWQRPGSAYAEEITAEFLAPPTDLAGALAGSQEMKLDTDFLVNAGRDQVIYLPRQSVALGAYEHRRTGSDTPLRTWTQVSGPGAVVFSSPGSEQTSAAFSKPGVYVLRYSLVTQRNTSADEVTVEVRPALSANTGAFTRQVWWKRNFATLDAFRADPSFPKFPDLSDNLLELRQNSDWADQYATRVTGILRVPPGPESTVNYRFAVSGDDAVEFSIASGPDPVDLRRICFATRPSGRDNYRNESTQISDLVALKPGGRYFVELLHRETWGSDFFAVSWAREGDNRFQVIDGSLGEPTLDVAPFSAGLNVYANAGCDRVYWWPHSKTRLSGSPIRVRDPGNPVSVAWRQTGGASAVLSAAGEAVTEVSFPGPGLYAFEFTVTESGLVNRDSVVIEVKRAQAGVTGFLTRSVWLDVNGAQVADLRTADPGLAFPHFEDLLPGVEPPMNWADLTGTRLKGTLTVPVGGAYTFWIVSDETAELSLDRKGGSGLQKIASSDHAEPPLAFDGHAWQRSAPLDLQAGVAYPLEAVLKEASGNDHLAIAMEGPATNGREIVSRGFLSPAKIAPVFNPELTVSLGGDRTLLWPQNEVTLAALVYDLKPGPGAVTYQWSGSSRGVKFDSPAAPVSGVTFPGPGTYEITMRAGDGTNAGSDTVLVTVRDPLVSGSGGILREVWTGIGGSGINDLKNSSAYTSGTPRVRDVLPAFETPLNWEDNYGQRLTGLFSVPTEGDYVFLLASDDESELLFNQAGEDAAGAVRVAHCPWASGRYNWGARPSQQSASFRLVPGKRYFLQAIHKEGSGDDYLAVAYRKADQTNAQAMVIPGALLSPPAGTKGSAFDTQMLVEAGTDLQGVWPRSVYNLQGLAADYVAGPQALAVRWSAVSGAAPVPMKGIRRVAAPAASAAKVTFSAPTSLQTEVRFPGPGRYVLQLAVTDGLMTRTDTLTANIGSPLATGTGSILCEIFRDIPGSWVTDLLRHSRYPGNPTERTQLVRAESRVNGGDNYGLVIRGWLHPALSGVYRFNIASDDWGEAHLSPDDKPENKALLCLSPAAVNYYEWRRFPEYQISRPVNLVAGRRYYLELRLKESGWNDHLALAWLPPGAPSFEVIDGAYLSPWKLADAQAPSVVLNGGSAVTVEVGGSFVDPGFTASDAVDGDLSQKVKSEGTVDTTTPGIYTIRYTATDAAGNVSEVATRTVTVALAPNVAPVYPPDTSGAHSVTPWSPPPGGITDLEAARFLRQATFGATEAAIARVKEKGFEGWIDEQLAMPASSHLAMMDSFARYQGARGDALAMAKASGSLSILPGRIMTGPVGTLRTDDRLWAWWTLAANAPDQLRQRIGFALSEILVVSDRSGTLRNYPRGMANYYDALVKHGNGSYRALLEEVTLNPIMGIWLTMLRSSKAQPDENYAREVMQLFSIGLEHLNRDGTYKRDGNGNALPTYTQAQINELARAFTGWTYAGSGSFTWTTESDVINPMVPFETQHDRGRKVILGGATLSAGQSARQDITRSLDVIFAHPNVGPFVSRLLIQRLVKSNPSPAYIFRVASKFENNGKGVRGDLGATVKAILLDPEARNPALAPEDGKLGEPVVRLTRLLRAVAAPPSSNPPVMGRYLVGNPLDEFSQAPLQAPTVFNFFLPGYVPPGSLAASGLVAPEFQITTELTTVDTANFFFDSVASGVRSSTGPRLALDLSSFEALWGQPEALYSRMEKLLLGRSMSAELRAALERVRTANSSAAEGVKAMLQVLLAAPDFNIDL